MPATNSELLSMEDPNTPEEEGSLTNTPSSAPPATMPVSLPPCPTTMSTVTDETAIENRAVSMTSHDCSTALSSPAEGSPAKPAVTSPDTFEGTVETNPASSRLASASDALINTGTSLASCSHCTLAFTLPSTPFGVSTGQEKTFSSSLTFNGVTVTLENNSVWKQFHACGTEMVLSKQGRRMFPYCRFRLAGLDPERQYSLVLSIVPLDQYKYRWNKFQWEIMGKAEYSCPSLNRSFAHHFSPCKGSQWMGSLVSFYKLKLTNNPQDQDGHLILHSMQRYIPRLHVIPIPDSVVTTSEQAWSMGLERMTFVFPQTEFMAVTVYQNCQITQLKINYNPFARGFRDDGHNSCVTRTTIQGQPEFEKDTQSAVSEPNESKEATADLSTKNHNIPTSVSNVQEAKLLLKPIMSTPSNKDEPHVHLKRAKHALGELVLIKKHQNMESMDEKQVTLKLQPNFKVMPRTKAAPTHAKSTLRPSLGYRKRRRKKKMNRRWGNARGRGWKTAAAAAAASSTVIHSPSLTVALQPEQDDVEGLLFVSFTSKESLESHVRNKPANSADSASVCPVTQAHLKPSVDLLTKADEDKLVCMEAKLLQDLRAIKYRQVIHPVLQEVGLKLSSLDPTTSIDLQYLGVHLPLTQVNLSDQVNATVASLGDNGLPFISRTGKTSDMTKIKGWKNKFIKSNNSSPKSDGLQKNLSAFCSDMLDEYLEREAKQISERAAAFSTSPEDSVAYQLPAKSSSYIKTLDSVLKHRNTASSRPGPLSHKSLLYSALTLEAAPLTIQTAPIPAEAQSIHQAASSHKKHGHASGTCHNSAVSQRSSPYHSGVNQKPTVSSGQNQAMTPRPSGYTKPHQKLLQMESTALNQGLDRTQLNASRLTVALSAVLTKQMLYSQALSVAPHLKDEAGPDCGRDYCRLGCVCVSLQQGNSGPLHCRRPECMFGCNCFKQLTPQQNSADETKTNRVHVLQPHTGSRINKLWTRNILDADAEPLCIPKSPPCLVPGMNPNHTNVTHPKVIKEEDKDPVYKYLESMMTCARVRAFKSKPPPKPIEPKVPDSSTGDVLTKQQKTPTETVPKYNEGDIATKKAAEKTCQEASETSARKQIQIQSACNWEKDSKVVLEALCQRMHENKLSARFCVGPYIISPITKVFLQKPSGSVVTYRVHISKTSDASDEEEDLSEDSDEERLGSKSSDGEMCSEDEDSLTEESEVQVGVTPFLGGVLPCGRLKARTKPVGLQPCGLIEVNGKTYNQARVLVGRMGSLHPANRLAAYVTGQLRVPSGISYKYSKKQDSTEKNNASGAPQSKAAETTVCQTPTAIKTPHVAIQHRAQPLVQFQPNSSSVTCGINPMWSFILNQRAFISQTSSNYSPVSLTVSPSLKTPSFLGQSGTYSFRICPPSNQGTNGQNLPGVTLPGGFTLIEIPKPGATEATQQSETANTTNTDSTNVPLSQKPALLHVGPVRADLDAKSPSPDTLHAGKHPSTSGSLEPDSLAKVTCDKNILTDESDVANSKNEEPDFTSEGEHCDSSDSCGEGDEDDEPVDIETVEEARERMAIAEMRKASQNSCDNFGSVKDPSNQDQMNTAEDRCKMRRNNYRVIECQRRSEQRVLFKKLQTVLQSNPRSTKAELLTMAIKEIQNLVEAAKVLEEKKMALTKMQSAYVKELSRLSGKSEVQIKMKLLDIYERQKIREKRMKRSLFFSQLLQSRASLLQETTPESQDTSLEPDIQPATSQTTGQLQPKHDTAQPKTLPTPQCPLPSTVSTSTPSYLPRSFGIPLVRSKTGRLILPSSLKPGGQGTYTLILMEPKQKQADGVTSSLANTHPSDVEPQNQETMTFSASAPPSSSDSSHTMDDNKTTSSQSDSKHPCLKSPLVKLACLNKSINVPLATAQAAKKSPEKAFCLSFIRVSPVSSPAKAKPEDKQDSNPSVVSRKGRPPKKSVVPLAGRDNSVKPDQKQAANTPATGMDLVENPVPVKRRRGRPPKRRPQGLQSPVAQKRRSASLSDKDLTFKCPDPKHKAAHATMNTSRPLTRGALGKDFPSAKKRSWIDMEKELEF